MKASYEQISQHFEDVLRIRLSNWLVINQPRQLNNYALTAPLVVAYRYAEALKKPLAIHDMTREKGHESHKFGSEFDFDLQGDRYNPVTQIAMTSDLLAIREALMPSLKAFRIGVYFDYFKNTEAKTFEQFKAKYKKIGESMHLGVRYRWLSEEYKGDKPVGDYDYFSLWGKGKGHSGLDNFWADRIRSWNIGLMQVPAHAVAMTILGDLKALDLFSPGLAHLRTKADGESRPPLAA
ncbi:MAG: hypothetical protein U1F68_04890 [Gammaproteobacteria bacterium]